MRHEIRKDIAEVEAELLAAIDQKAEEVRARYITNTPAQAAVYLEKEREALAIKADPAIDGADVPHLAREAARLGQSLDAVATTVLARAAYWRQVSAVIEDLRLAAKERVRAAGTVPAKRAAMAIDWSQLEEFPPTP